MGTRGKVKCACLDCDTIRFAHRREFDRAGRPRCFACGGSINIVSCSGQKKLVAGYSACRKRREGQSRILR
jgi:hypothetical protein